MPRRGRAARSRAAWLLEQLLQSESATTEALSVSLEVSSRELLEYVEGKRRMPLESQRRLAALIVDQMPVLTREARRLELQCAAEERFLAGETQTHMIAPAGRFR